MDKREERERELVELLGELRRPVPFRVDVTERVMAGLPARPSRTRGFLPTALPVGAGLAASLAACAALVVSTGGAGLAWRSLRTAGSAALRTAQAFAPLAETGLSAGLRLLDGLLPLATQAAGLLPWVAAGIGAGSLLMAGTILTVVGRDLTSPAGRSA